MLHLQVTCGIQNQRQEVCCACWDHHAFVPISWTCKEQTAVSHSSAESEIISLYAGLRSDGLPAVQFRERVLDTLSCKTAKGNVTNARESSRLIHILTLVYLSQLTWLLRTFPTVHTQPNTAYSKTMRQWSEWSTEDGDQTKGMSQERTESMWIWLFLSDCIWLILVLMKYVRTNNELADILTEGMFTTMQWHSFLCLWQNQTNLLNHVMSAAFSRKPFHLLSFSTAPSSASGDDTRRMCSPDVGSILIEGIENSLHSG